MRFCTDLGFFLYSYGVVRRRMTLMIMLQCDAMRYGAVRCEAMGFVFEVKAHGAVRWVSFCNTALGIVAGGITWRNIVYHVPRTERRGSWLGNSIHEEIPDVGAIAHRNYMLIIYHTTRCHTCGVAS